MEGPSEHLQVIVEERRGSNGDGLESDAMRAVEGAEAIIYKSIWITFYGIAEKLDVPCASAMLMPLTRTGSFPSFLIGGGKNRGRMTDSSELTIP